MPEVPWQDAKPRCRMRRGRVAVSGHRHPQTLFATKIGVSVWPIFIEADRCIYARTEAAGQVVSALSFGGLGTLLVVSLEIALAGGIPAGTDVQNLGDSVTAIAFSYSAGSYSARVRAPGRA